MYFSDIKQDTVIPAEKTTSSWESKAVEPTRLDSTISLLAGKQDIKIRVGKAMYFFDLGADFQIRLPHTIYSLDIEPDMSTPPAEAISFLDFNQDIAT